MLTSLLVLAVLFVAFTNGANANFKGVASLYGSGTTSLKTALLWGTALTLAGSMAAYFLADGMLKKFSGRGIVPDDLVQAPQFCTAVALGAAITSFLATRWGFPVSTTHALLGALVGAGWMGSGTGVNLSALGSGVIYPLVFSPLIAMLCAALLTTLLRRTRTLPKQRSRQLDICHFISTGAASFARGLNDTPKMVALMLVMNSLSLTVSFLSVAIMIAIGAWLDARNVAETLGKKITGMDPGEGFIASLVTAGLVTTASLHSMPVSTTHVSVGSLLGIGYATHQAYWNKARDILLAWLCTVPCGALLAALGYLLVNLFGSAEAQLPLSRNG